MTPSHVISKAISEDTVASAADCISSYIVTDLANTIADVPGSVSSYTLLPC